MAFHLTIIHGRCITGMAGMSQVSNLRPARPLHPTQILDEAANYICSYGYLRACSIRSSAPRRFLVPFWGSDSFDEPDGLCILPP
jgi:hypothetical protein